MKRHLLITLTLFLGLSAIASARSSGTSITVTPDEMKAGEAKTFADGDTKVTLRRDGNTIRVEIEGAGKTRTLTITRSGDGDFVIERDGVRRHRIHLDGTDLNLPRVLPHAGRTQTWFVCPKDRTSLRVPEGKENETYKCPVDGTTMEKRKGHGFSLFFDDDFFRSEDL